MKRLNFKWGAAAATDLVIFAESSSPFFHHSLKKQTDLEAEEMRLNEPQMGFKELRQFLAEEKNH